MQVINTKEFGDLTFIRTWTDGHIHIGKLEDGGFCHIGGPPISTRAELEDAIPRGPQLEDALDWWENKDKAEQKKKSRRIMIQDDGSYVFEDGSPIESVDELVACIPTGPALDAAVAWYVEANKDKIERKIANKETADERTLENLELLKKRTCDCGFIAKNEFGLQAHQRVCKVHKAVELKKSFDAEDE
jgi:hypothetical protein